MEPVPEKKKEKNFATTTQKRRRDDASPTATTTTTTTTAATQSRGGGGGGGGQNLFKRGGAKATKYSELLEREKPDAKLPTREELRVKTTEQSLEQFDVLVNAWSRQRKVSTNNIAVAIWDKKLKLAKLVKQKGKSLSKFGYSANAKMTGGTTETQTQTTTDNGGGTVYLFPEEIAFLVETERVCLFWQARGRGLEPASVKSIHGMLKECGVSMETYVTYAQLCRIGYVARRFGAPWVVPERVKAKARKKRENETYLHRKMAGEGDWVFRGVDNNNRTGRCDIDEEKEEKEEEDDDGKMELDEGGTTVATSDNNKNDVNIAIEEKVKVDEEETVELQNYPGSRPWFFWSGSKYHPWLGPEIHALYAQTQKRMAEERRKRETEKETLRREEEKQELNKISDGGRTWPTFDVWRPNGNFKKSSPGEPDFRIAVCLGRPPHGKEAELLWKRSKNVKLKIANVESGAIMLFDLEAGLAR